MRDHSPPAWVSTLVLWISVRCLRGRADRALEGVPDDPLDAEGGVEADLGGDLVRGVLAQHPAVADVRALGALADARPCRSAGSPASGLRTPA